MNNSYNKVRHCSNCGEYGHFYKQCHNPVLSYGIILFKINLKAKYIGDKIQMLLLQRKHTYSYMDFIRGKYNYKNQFDIHKLKLNINNMTIQEVNNIINYDFDTLWCDLWNIKNANELNNRFKKEYKIARDKFNKLTNNSGYLCDIVFIKYLKNIRNTLYKTPEYGFAKGRRNNHENDLDCAIREFCEETNYSIKDIDILNHNRTFNEKYIALNNINYEHKYYIALCNTNKDPYIDKNNKEQVNEIKNIKWCSLNEVIKSIRKYEKWKIILVKEAFSYFINYIKLYKKIYYG